MEKHLSKERGQILVLVALVFGVLLGFAALAVDGGMVYSNRRYTQNVADSASLAGGSAAAHWLANNSIVYNNFSCSNSQVITALAKATNAAMLRANSNNFNITIQPDEATLKSSKHGVFAKCVVDNATRERFIVVEVMITADTNTAFAHMFFKGAIKNTVEATTRIRPRTSPGFNYAIASLGTSCGSGTGGIDFNGASQTYINGGGVFSNSCMTFNGTSPTGYNVQVDNGTIELAYPSEVRNGNPVISPNPVGNQPVLPTFSLNQMLDGPVPCGSDPLQSIDVKNGDVTTIDSGNFSLIKVNNGGKLTLTPGLYCLQGNLDIEGGTVIANDVTFYLKTGWVKIVGDSSVTMSASGEPGVNGSLPGMLILFDDTNTSTIFLEGNGSSLFRGTIYGLHADVDVGGAACHGTGCVPANQEFETQLVGEYVKTHGNAGININFLNADPFKTPTRLDLTQ